MAAGLFKYIPTTTGHLHLAVCGANNNNNQKTTNLIENLDRRRSSSSKPASAMCARWGERLWMEIVFGQVYVCSSHTRARAHFLECVRTQCKRFFLVVLVCCCCHVVRFMYEKKKCHSACARIFRIVFNSREQKWLVGTTAKPKTFQRAVPYDAINDFCGTANGLADARRVFTYLFRFVVFLFSLEAGGEGHRREAQNLGIFSAPISSIGIDLECECVSVCVWPTWRRCWKCALGRHNTCAIARREINRIRTTTTASASTECMIANITVLFMGNASSGIIIGGVTGANPRTG